MKKIDILSKPGIVVAIMVALFVLVTVAVSGFYPGTPYKYIYAFYYTFHLLAILSIACYVCWKISKNNFYKPFVYLFGMFWVLFLLAGLPPPGTIERSQEIYEEMKEMIEEKEKSRTISQDDEEVTEN